METKLNLDNNEQRRIGLELHQAETAIGVGRRVVSELLECEPVDILAIEAERSKIIQARLTRNELRRQLDEAKAKQAIGRGEWLSWRYLQGY